MSEIQKESCSYYWRKTPEKCQWFSVGVNFSEVIGFSFETSGNKGTKQRYLPEISMKSNN